MTTHPVGTLARITYADPLDPDDSRVTVDAIRGVYRDTGNLVWLTATRSVADWRVTSVVPLIPIDLASRDELNQLVDDANRNGAGLTVHDLAYALREHRARAAEPKEPTPAQRPASNSDARKRAAEAGGDR